MGEGWNRNVHYNDLVLNAVPRGCERALAVGCGVGRLTSELALRCREVVAIDADALVLSRARDRAQPNVTFIHGDVMTQPLDEGAFDFITLVAALHQLPLERAFARLQPLLCVRTECSP